jgi:glycosyltransferase involved in cell wall biosynthesis
MSKIGYKNLSTEDKANVALAAVLQESKRAPASSEKQRVETVTEARTKPLLSVTTGRRTTRVLFVTTDTAILTQATTSLDGFTAIADMFDEVYIMVLRTGVKARHPVLRVASQTWLYTVTAKHDWQLPFAAWNMMQHELFFADGFRPDLIVARDSHVSAVTVYMAGVYFKRPTQLHLPERQDKVSAFFYVGQWATKHFLSIRTTTTDQVSFVEQKYPHATDVLVLPRYRDYISHFNGEKSNFLTTKYPQFNFIVLYVGNLSTTSTAFQAIDAMRDILRNPRAGLVMVGDGSGVLECYKRAELLGFKDQVIIERSVSELTDYFASADVLLVTDTDSDADEIVLWGAAAGIPLVITDTPLRRDMFTHDVSAYIASVGHVVHLGEYLYKLLNNPLLRENFRFQVRRIAEQKLFVDPAAYRIAYRDSLERAILVTESQTT